MNKERTFLIALGSIALLGCGGASAGGEASSAYEVDAPREHEAVAEEDGAFSEADGHAPEGAEPSEQARTEPEFTAGMSVLEATNAVPETIERLNIEQEALAEPLLQPELYEPCSLQGHHHFKVKVAVWNGRAVGVDVTTQPDDEKLESCLRQQISSAEWNEKAKSINTVEYSY